MAFYKITLNKNKENQLCVILKIMFLKIHGFLLVHYIVCIIYMCYMPYIKSKQIIFWQVRISDMYIIYINHIYHSISLFPNHSRFLSTHLPPNLIFVIFKTHEIQSVQLICAWACVIAWLLVSTSGDHP